jgi:sulfonate transport system ATP-binding protein
MNALLAKPPVAVAAVTTKSTVERMPLLRARNLSKQFDGRTVLAGIDIDLGPGEAVAIVGRSGCGKTTLLRVLAGLERASGGDLALAGQHLTGLNHAARLMFQDACLLPWKTVLQNVLLATPELERLREARQALSRVGLLDRADDWPATLSGGQRQRVALARALASNTPLLFLDEPLGALDALTRLEMQSLIENLWLEKRFGTLLITHDVEEAVALADRVLVMANGRFVADVSVDLPRPRARGSREFLALREQLLARVLDRHPAKADLR